MDAPSTFRQELAAVALRHQPSRHAFFRRLPEASSDHVRSPAFLAPFYRRYQAAMHSTRVMVYRMPHLDHASMRAKKLAIYVDDDGLPGGDTHHAQLERMFRALGTPPENDGIFADLDELRTVLDPKTAHFVATVQELYGRSLGAWCVAEGVSEDWLRALALGLEPHFPRISREPYFAECFDTGVEVRHGHLSVDLTCEMLAQRPDRLDGTVYAAWRMGEAMDELWDSLEELV
jgi:hypothetical protein